MYGLNITSKDGLTTGLVTVDSLQVLILGKTHLQSG